jgi:patatin-like phospholipase/acyl hydrolase
MTNLDNTIKWLSEVNEKRTHGLSYINQLQSSGCELSFFNKEYTVFLNAREPHTIESKNFVRTEIDAEFITLAANNIPKLLEAVKKMRDALEFYIEDGGNKASQTLAEVEEIFT